jgi:hypothetical protein
METVLLFSTEACLLSPWSLGMHDLKINTSRMVCPEPKFWLSNQEWVKLVCWGNVGLRNTHGSVSTIPLLCTLYYTIP